VSSFGVIEKLRRNHLLDGFDCGKDELNRFLRLQAWSSQQGQSAQTYVLAKDSAVLGFYSLAAGAVTHDNATDRVHKGQARHPIPVILLARLAVDLSMQKRGLGPALLKDALLRAARAADTIGARAILVYAKDDDAKGFYAHFDFEPSPSDPYNLLLIMKDVLKNIDKFGT
jgi:GNAT superfamily N-acetyltransferase